ncbi:hypothetical protein ABNG30_17015 [Bacillus thuringiensis]
MERKRGSDCPTVINALDLIKGIIEFVMPVVLFIIEELFLQQVLYSIASKKPSH